MSYNIGFLRVQNVIHCYHSIMASIETKKSGYYVEEPAVL